MPAISGDHRIKQTKKPPIEAPKGVKQMLGERVQLFRAGGFFGGEPIEFVANFSGALILFCRNRFLEFLVKGIFVAQSTGQLHCGIGSIADVA